ncbi:chromosomal replication initiator protein DnaA [Desulfosarcina ovata subsp. sediminis]|uniref:Chromosomal replication initiator protein DnaA n=1 Tax=Desulfosarcina ovata subsp. sediminis TaxID=885957 RepID=A0A5K7ZGN5_9BACT|nr:chromosomal replication initiator protein DnaA [Desulfosarcina ovata]BBO79435.1 chromosomal replication initiator protein DnaA [Desulfosarcina ovata subsp. sediminis]
MDQIWKRVKSLLKEKVPGHSYRMWIEPIEFCEDCADTIVLSCPNPFSRKRISEQYGKLIESALCDAAGQPLKMNLIVGAAHPADSPENPEERQMKLPEMDLPARGGQLLRQDYTFDQFVVGKNSDFAYTAALSLAARKLGNQNALYLHSKTGLGKSHLSQAVGHHILKAFPNERVYYITAEDFMNEMTGAYRSDNIHQFKDKYRHNCDVLLLEDVHFLSGKNGTQEELSNTLESLMNSNKKVIYSSCYLPSEIPKVNDKLKSRLSCGLISKIDLPDYKVRLRILKKAARSGGFALPDIVLQYLASELVDDVRQLKSGLIGVAARASLLGSAVDLELARNVVDDIVTRREQITLDSIKQLVCKYYKVTLADLTSRSRRQAIVRPRQVAMYLSRRYTDHSLQTIGRSFNRYHATTLHALKAVEKGLKENGPFQKHVDFLSQRLEKGWG